MDTGVGALSDGSVYFVCGISHFRVVTVHAVQHCAVEEAVVVAHG